MKKEIKRLVTRILLITLVINQLVFTYRNNKEHEKLWNAVIETDELLLETKKNFNNHIKDNINYLKNNNSYLEDNAQYLKEISALLSDYETKRNAEEN